MKPVIRKPLIDLDAVLAFAVTATDIGGVKPEPVHDRGTVVSISFQPDEYERLSEDAGRKGRSVDQHIKKIVIKHLKR